MELEEKLMGRPTDYTQDLADQICELLSEGMSMRSIAKIDGMPVASAMFRWLRTYPEFKEQYTRAKQESADAMAEDILDISDDATNDWMLTADDESAKAYRLNGENIQRSRLRVESRKWLMSKMKPKKYGEKMQTEHTGEVVQVLMEADDYRKARAEAIKQDDC